MSFLELIGDLIDLICSWRFYLCLGAGLLIGAGILKVVSFEPVAWVLAGGVFIAAFVVGWRWESSSE
jgi:hypothetical protein